MNRINFLSLIRKESINGLQPLICMAAISGVANAGLLAIINQAAMQAGLNEDVSFRMLLLFIIALSLFLYCKKYALTNSTALVEEVVFNVRMRIIDKIRQANILFVEKLGRSEIYTMVTQETNIISQSTNILVNACQSGIMLFFCAFYLAWLSKTALFITMIALICGILIYLSNHKALNEQIQESIKQEKEFFDSLSHILEGMKEIKLSRKKNDDLFHGFKTISQYGKELRTNTGIKFIHNFMFSQMFWYVLLGIIVFLLPTVSDSYSEIVTKVTIAIFFMIGPLEVLIGSIPIFANANVAISNIYEFEGRLDKADFMMENYKDTVTKKPGPFKKIKLQNMSFQYQDEEKNVLFSLGPINLTINHGEILFIVGGNGSGKTSLLKLITGLYYPKSGSIKMDEKELQKRHYPAYREFFSGVFGDFHLFDKLYGLKDVDEEEVNSLIRLMQLQQKTEFVDGKFSHIDLSTGQRKRLAVIASLLDDKPILVFDELAADQDPAFRKYYYEVFLGNLKKQGKTIVAISHDDRYFSVADRVIKMEYGKIEKAK